MNLNTDAYAYAKVKMYAKLSCLFLACIAAAVIAGSLMGGSAFVLVPLFVALIPLCMGLYYTWLFKKGRISCTEMTITDKKRDIVGGLISEVSLSHKKYCFEYMDEQGEKQSFFISRGGLFNTFAVGERYLVLYNSQRQPAPDNFLEAVKISGKEDGDSL